MELGKPVKQAIAAVVGGVLVLVGVALLVLPGPGLLLVLAGLVVLASQFPALERFVDPVRTRAMKAAEDSVASPLRIAGSVLAGLALFAAGIVWGTVDWLPFSGWSTGSSIILSGVILFALLIWSYRRVKSREGEARSAPAGQNPGMTTSDSPQVPAAIQQFVDATNKADAESFVDAFTSDAFLEDWGRKFHGHEGVLSWNETDNIGVGANFTVKGIKPGKGADNYVLTLGVKSNRFNGTGTMTIDLREGKIASLVIS